MRIIAFDIDETLQCAGGPVPLWVLNHLRSNGDMVGLCGNWARAMQADPFLYSTISFFSACCPSKENFLADIRKYLFAERYIMVGNVPGVSGMSDDVGAALRAGWEFVQEKDWQLLIH